MSMYTHNLPELPHSVNTLQRPEAIEAMLVELHRLGQLAKRQALHAGQSRQPNQAIMWWAIHRQLARECAEVRRGFTA